MEALPSDYLYIDMATNKSASLFCNKEDKVISNLSIKNSNNFVSNENIDTSIWNTCHMSWRDHVGWMRRQPSEPKSANDSNLLITQNNFLKRDSTTNTDKLYLKSLNTLHQLIGRFHVLKNQNGDRRHYLCNKKKKIKTYFSTLQQTDQAKLGESPTRLMNHQQR